MRYVIDNGQLRVEADSLGGELQSVKKDGGEYLWQADPAYWTGKAPNLFPYIARLTEGKYVLDGQTYSMSIHGFAHNMEMKAEEADGNRLVFRLDADEETRACYPFEFTYRIIYELDGTVLHITYQVENRGTKEMYFGVGGHPGFCLPLGQGAEPKEKENAFEDYYLEFGEEADGSGENAAAGSAQGMADAPDCPVRIGFTPSCFLNGEDVPYPLEDGNKIRLRHDLFDNDAIVLKGVPKCVTLRAQGSGRRVKVSYPDMTYLGIWHAVKKPAPYVCIEPWSSLPSRQDVVEDLAAQPGLIHLQGGGCYRNAWEIAFE